MRSTLLMVLLAGCTDPACDAASVEAALASAASGDVVEIGACEVERSLRVPEGVTLRGRGELASVVAGTVTLASGASLEALTVRAELGHAVDARDITSAITLHDVALVGPVTDANVADLGSNPSAEETATHGLVVSGGAAQLENVTVRGFARFGALFLGSDVTWSGGGAEGNRATGLMAAGGTIVLTDLRVADTFDTRSGVPSYGAVFRDGATVTTERLVLEANDGYGAIHDGVSAEHVDLRGDDNSLAALWAQESPSFTLSGTASALARNGLAAIVTIGVDAVSISDAEISETRSVTRIVGARSIEVGDGIHVALASTGGLRVGDVQLIDNERAGLLIQTADGIVSPDAIGAITVSATGTGLGAVAQSETGVIAPGTWGASIVREGAAIANDTALASRIDVVSAVAPMFFPAE